MFTTFKQIARLFRISVILIKHGLNEIVAAIQIFRLTRWAVPLVLLVRKPSTKPIGERLCLALEELGPIFVKFGQMLSTRSDLIGEEIAIELAKLQDQVKPFPSEIAKNIIEQTLGAPLTELFSTFEREPLASASVAQVHAATLKDGQCVVVKILRPHIQKQIEADIALLKTLAASVHKTWKPIRHFKPKEIIREFEKSILGELNLQQEAANTAQLRRNFENSPLLYVPKVYWPYVRKNVLVLERIHGISVSDVPVLQAKGINLKRLAERGVEIFFTQVFRNGFFHADMHPGNIFVSPDHTEFPQYIAVDCGIVGTLNSVDQRYIAENFLAFWQRDYGKIARLHVESGWVPNNIRLDEFENTIRALCEPILGLPLKEISFATFLMRLFSAARAFDIQIQPQLTLLQKTLFYVEGVGRKLYPDLDPWQVGGPFLETWVRQRVHPMVFWKKMRDSAPYWAETIPKLSELVLHALAEREPKKPKKNTTQKTTRRLVLAIFSSTLFLCAFFLAVFGMSTSSSWLLGMFSLILAWFAWF